MEKSTKTDIMAKLKYLGLDLDNVPDCLNSFNAINFNVSRFNNDKDHKVFKYVPIDKIEILLTPNLRSENIKKKYSEAIPLSKYLNPGDEEEDVERYNTLLKMVTSLSVSDVENISSIQMKLEKTEPFKVKYSKDHLWQIYYSEATDRYFMLVCTKEITFSEFFYIIKKKIEIENKKPKTMPKIYVPINYLNFSEALLNLNEIIDIENYLWVLTKNWCLIFEVYNKDDEISVQIIGDTFIYDKVKSSYKIKLTTQEEAIKFYKLIKVLFILQTEVKSHFEFTTQIDSKNNLEFYFGKSRITYDSLTEFIKNEYMLSTEAIKDKSKNIVDLNKKLDKLNNSIKIKEDEYQVKQKEISTYLECKKTFMGKVKYFLKSNKKNPKNSKEEKERDKKEETQKEEKGRPEELYLEEKEFYTLEDLVVVYSFLEKKDREYKGLNQDIRALELKYENIVSKVKNATQYIEEIDKNKKSIFDFWKFANKDEKLSLEMAAEKDKENYTTSLKKVFDFEIDFDNMGINVDNTQRKKLSREEIDSMFIAKTDILRFLNMIKSNELDKDSFESALSTLRDEFNKNRLYIDSETFDIFGNIEDDNRKIKYIGDKSHRENEKSKFKILNINKKIDVFDFTEKLHGLVNYIEGAVPKINSVYDITLYKLVPITEKINEKYFEIFNINIEKELEEYQDNGEGALNLLKLNYKEGMPILYYSNIIFYDNNNQTLPSGMNISTNVLIDCSRLKFKLAGKSRFRTNNYFTESNNLILPKSKDIFVYEYDVEIKEIKE